MKNLNHREYVRGPELQLLCRGNQMHFFQAVQTAQSRRLVIASNKRVDQAIHGFGYSKIIEKNVPLFTGTMTAYEEPQKKLGAEIEYAHPNDGLRWIFPVPGEYRGERDVVLISEHPRYSIEKDGNNLLILAEAVDALPLRRDGMLDQGSDNALGADSEHGIPCGEKSGPKRYLRRTGKRVGPIVRHRHDPYMSVDYRHHGRECVYLTDYRGHDFWANWRSVLIEAPILLNVQMILEEDKAGVLVKGITLDRYLMIVSDAAKALASLKKVLRPGLTRPLERLSEMLLPKTNGVVETLDGICIPSAELSNIARLKAESETSIGQISGIMTPEREHMLKRLIDSILIRN